MNKIGEYVHKGMVKRVMQCTVFADIFDEWQLSGSDRPTLVWAPGVPESRHIVEEFRKRGVTAEHIDGETEDDDRERIRDGSKVGSIRIVSSFGVMREGVDWPWVSYGILVQVCGAYETFVQLVGRILRASPGKTDAILQDHAGTWWRHGSPNFDREWSLDDTNIKIAKERAESMSKSVSDGGDPEPICCPQCHGLRMSGVKCPHCGYEHSKSVRMIRSEGGDLVEMEGDVFPKVKPKSTTGRHWSSVLFRIGSTGGTFATAAYLFHKETGKWPYNDGECRPKPPKDSPIWRQKVADVYPKFNRRAIIR
jgi:DNA repair protein RadD